MKAMYKTVRKHLYILWLLILIILSFVVSGCGTQKETKNSGEESGEDQEIIKIYCDIYEKVKQMGTSESPKVSRNIVEALGKRGYTAVDSENQVNMTRSEQTVAFCKAVEEKEEAELTILVVSGSD